MSSDREIAELVRNGHPGPFGELVERYQSSIGRYLFRLTGDYHTAQDLTQDTFIKAFEGIAATGPGLSFKAWLFRIATNNAYQFFRRKKLLAFVPFTDTRQKEMPSGAEEADCTENRVVVEGTLMKIAPERRTCMLLHFVEGLKYGEIGEILGITEEAARKRVSRGCEEFKKLYSGSGGTMR